MSEALNAPFTGEVMACAACGRQRKSDPASKTDWRLIESGAKRFYFCPNEFPPDGSSQAKFQEAYARAMRIVLAEVALSAPYADANACEPEVERILSRDAAPTLSMRGILEGRSPVFTEEDMAVLKAMPAVCLDLDTGPALQVMAALQLACRHPKMPPTVRETAEAVARALQQHLSATPNLAAVMESGWLLAADVDSRERSSGA